MATTYEKLSQSTEKSLNEIIREEDTYIAAFKTNVENYKIPVADFNNNKVYIFTAKRTYTQFDTKGTLTIYDKNNTPLTDPNTGITLFQQLYNAGYTLLIKVVDDKMPYYENLSERGIDIDDPAVEYCLFSLSSTYIDRLNNKRIFKFTFTEAENDIVNVIYTITVKYPSGNTPFATMQFINPYARIETMATNIGENAIDLNHLSDPTYYSELLNDSSKTCGGNGRYGLPDLDYKTQAFNVYLWDQNGSSNNFLNLTDGAGMKPSRQQKDLRAEYIIIWTNGSPMDSQIASCPVIGEVHINSIINDDKEEIIKLISDGNDIVGCNRYALFKITAVGYGWEVTPLYNCQFYTRALYYGVYAYKDLTNN